MNSLSSLLDKVFKKYLVTVYLNRRLKFTIGNTKGFNQRFFILPLGTSVVQVSYSQMYDIYERNYRK